MKVCKTTLQENGQLILPAELCQMLGVGTGDLLILRESENGVELTTARRSRELARERVRRRFPDSEGVVDAFRTERRAEAAREGEAMEGARAGGEVGASDDPP